ncbi:Ppx/GppA phosphatase [Dinoroseobacter shibae DFL 12 = DSM 16493]|uniref:Ppx/GppA phosphatase n=1 Tax=Dinoroseobacter shibae (strain DSM 16493 / NCIMB 14021 / DFL 12) TaxID=398580 RepID=A8LQU1_DINSH|nr:Ppx/GppA family phosphatase [Dinoroseobacter shibae]ABV92484.1 Ppx/GppA phosphatase [Dinoroseobacter shibae DFL 12 = DSM 16493]URF47428.1 Ppx/GppA family phosphatase [Dinoroseobacter shibae]URF51739.1 Ppx/GppA family phosphatase [Dinoroseobacter shibae]
MQDEDWGPFGKALFEDPSAQALGRVGVIDVGSNSVRMVVFDGAARSPAYFYNEKVMAGLGAGLSQSGRLNPEGRIRAMDAMKRFVLLAQSMNVSPLVAVATAAMREAEDGPAFREELTQETGLRLWVIDGAEEARLSAQGVLLGWPGATGLVCDIGGSSLELAELSEGQVGKRETSALGPLKLRDVPGGKKGLKAHIRSELDTLRARIDGSYDRLFLVGGSWRAIARLDMIRREYPLAVLHEYRMSPRAVSETIAMIQNNTPEALRAMSGIGEARMSLLPEAAQVLGPLIRTFRPKEIAVSAYGIREGLLYEQMPQKLRNRDPLIEACRYMEAQSSRIPGFGRGLYEFLKPLFSSEKASGRRLIKAACLLHDISWRAHPDYRAEVCFDTATRANLGGLSHSERIFLGLALLHRYKNSRSGSRFEHFFELLPEKDQKKAEVLGKAMRFGAMLAAQDPSKMGRLKLYPKKKVLELRMPVETRDLFGEVAQARFKSLAAALEAEARVLI